MSKNQSPHEPKNRVELILGSFRVYITQEEAQSLYEQLIKKLKKEIKTNGS